MAHKKHSQLLTSAAHLVSPDRGAPVICGPRGAQSSQDSAIGPKERGRARYISTPEAAEYLGVSESYLNKARHFGTGPDFVRMTPRAIRYDIDALDAWARARSVSARAQGE